MIGSKPVSGASQTEKSRPSALLNADLMWRLTGSLRWKDLDSIDDAGTME